MRTTISISFLIGFSTMLGLVTFAVNAQAKSETLGQCVRGLNNVNGPYNDDRRQENVKTCINTLATQAPTQTLGQCVNALNNVNGPYNDDRRQENTAACSKLIRVQITNEDEKVQRDCKPEDRRLRS